MRPYKTQQFAICDTCARLKETVALTSGATKEAAQAHLNRHIVYVKEARAAMEARTKYAREHPDEVLYINIDGMDQAKTNLPNDLAKGKSDDTGRPLVAKLLGAIAYGCGWWGFWSFPEWSPCSNLTLTALCKMFRDIAGADHTASDVPTRRRRLPPVLYLQMDNTSKDNKNHYLVGFCGMLVAEGIFKEVRVFFLPVGHTHQEIDQTFSLVSRGLNIRGALCLADLMEVAQGAWGDHTKIGSKRKVNTRFDHVLDFRRLLTYDKGRRCRAAVEDDGPLRVYHFKGLGTDGNKR